MAIIAKYGVGSDSHLHNWGTFSEDEDGINSRLKIILDELLRAAKTIRELGGKRFYHTGDLFHVRGSIAPSVHHPTVETFRKITEEIGLEVRILAGNHDLESNDSKEETNGVESLRTINGVTVVSGTQFFDDDKVCMIAWHNKKDDLLKAIAEATHELEGREECVEDWDLMIHAAVDGVIDGLPSHGITAADLEAYGFNRVYFGHYHNHKELTEKVVSVGATTHQTWGDIDSHAGFLIIGDDDTIYYHRTEAPEFRDYDSAVITTEDEAKDFAKGHYVRVRLGVATPSQVEKMREWLTVECGAKGVLIQAQPKSKVAEREGGATIEAGESINKSISEWLSKQSLAVKQEDIEAECEAILGEIDGEE